LISNRQNRVARMSAVPHEAHVTRSASLTCQFDSVQQIGSGSSRLIRSQSQPSPEELIDMPQRYLLAVAYQPGVDTRIEKGADGHRDFFTEAELEKAAWSMLLGGEPEVGLYHADGTVGHAKVVESYVYRGPDWTLTAVDGSTQVIKSGTWLTGLLCDDIAWRMYERGEVQGVSLQGAARRRRTA
jgi:hypothetical protein